MPLIKEDDLWTARRRPSYKPTTEEPKGRETTMPAIARNQRQLGKGGIRGGYCEFTHN